MKTPIIILIAFSMIIATSMAVPVHGSKTVYSCSPPCTNMTIGHSDNGILVTQWNHTLLPRFVWGWFGSSAAIADLGPDVNTNGTEPDADLEIVVGSDEFYNWYPELGAYAAGIWRTFDSQGNIEWARDTETDEARSSPAIADINGDGNLEIAGGTTSGWNVEVMDRFGNWTWTFPWPPTGGGSYLWHSSPAIADINESVAGLELVEGCGDYLGTVFAFDGDNSDGIDEGISYFPETHPWYYYPNGTLGKEGIDWDVLWAFETYAPVRSTPAIGDVDNDGQLEVVVGSDNGNVYILNGSDGSHEWTWATGDYVKASPALANLDDDPYLEIVIGSMNGLVYCLEWDGTTGIEEWKFSTDGPVLSSAAIGDIDGDDELEIVVGSCDMSVYSISSKGNEEWNFLTSGLIKSSPALADRMSVNKYDRDWPFFRHDVTRTGFYGPAPSTGLDIYIGSSDSYLYLLDGNDGSMIDRFRTDEESFQPDSEIYTSPSVADTDGDKHFEIFFYSAHSDGDTNDTFWCIEDQGPGIEPPVAVIDGGHERTACEGDLMIFDGSASYDPNGHIVSYEWDFDVELDSDGDGDPDNDVDAKGPIATFKWYDDFEVDVKLTVTDNEGLTNFTLQHVTALNVNPKIVFEGTFQEYELSLRVAGEKWHNVELKLVTNYDAENETWDEEIGVLEVERWPGDPDLNPSSGNSIPVSVNITEIDTYTAIITYDPYEDQGDAIMDDQPINGQEWGGNPVWLIAKFPDGTECIKHHTFNVQQSMKRDSDLWNHVEPWIVPLHAGAVMGIPIKFVATASEPGSDDLNITWNWGDNSSDLKSYLFDPIRGFDPSNPPGSPYEPYGAPWDSYYPMGGGGQYPPLSITDESYYTYWDEGIHTIILTINDDDTDFDTYTLDIDVRGKFGG